ncbi:MAG TPA: phosphoribosylformylglycinamidine cyclo-ligase [Nitrospiria bacterium]|jgi:phosphoribosylformylglycinamidine cyclo-ligase|nr:phosphoribosylformylglycinamidine cyclo-ligase [Nitrospiria bacterium]
MPRLTYKRAGVDIEAGDEFVRSIKPLVRSTFRPEVLTDIGGFGGLFGLEAKKYKDPVLVSGTDGVGTKLRIAIEMNRHNTVGIDLVAMSVNDVVVTGAEPLFFLDYLATGKLQPQTGVEIIRGIVNGCRQAGCALLGGETAEMPSFYPEGVYDLAGFAVGVIEKGQVIDGSRIKAGDVLIGLASSGLHSNGFSLARKISFEVAGHKLTDRIPGWTQRLGDELLTPTKIYVKSVLQLVRDVDVKGLAHITGGGLTGNIPRILPEGCQARIKRGSWPVPAVFGWLEKQGGIVTDEMYRVFNMGIGMVAVIGPEQADQAMERLKSLGEPAFLIGKVIHGEKKVSYE